MEQKQPPAYYPPQGQGACRVRSPRLPARATTVRAATIIERGCCYTASTSELLEIHCIKTLLLLRALLEIENVDVVPVKSSRFPRTAAFSLGSQPA